MKKVSFGISDYYHENKYKSSVDLQKMKTDFSHLRISVRSLPKNYDTLCLCLTKLVFSFSVIGLTETWLVLLTIYLLLCLKYDRVLILGDFNIHLCCPSHSLTSHFLDLIDSSICLNCTICNFCRYGVSQSKQ